MAITIRERFTDGRGVGDVGSLRNPRPLPIKLDTAYGYKQTLDVRLGYEAIPSTQFWQIETDRRTEIRAQRRSTDPLAVHVAIALLGPDSTLGPGRVSLVDTADGVGRWHVLEKGRWWLVAATGMPIDISIELDIEARPFWFAGSAVVPPPCADSVVIPATFIPPADSASAGDLLPALPPPPPPCF